MGIGEQLSHTRKAKGISLETAEEATKIRAKFLRALENEEFNVLPGRVYAKAFLRSYARYLELDDAQLVCEFDRLYAEKPQPEKKQRFEMPRSFNWGRYLNLFAVVAVIGLLVAFNAVYGKVIGGQVEGKPSLQVDTADQQPDNPPVTVSENTDQANQAEEADSSPEENARQDQGLSVRLNVTRDTCWMRVVTDGTVAFEGELQAGEERSFQAQSAIQLRLGNAGAVEVSCNGQSFGYLGGAGQVVTREFTAEQG
ncbi:MAG TPA: helix-turn-helix domain-containing protein [Desulfotomaculum sp.]|nr:helix-turn-helix domain-containing protein [Desulfotomaculum sp.]